MPELGIMLAWLLAASFALGLLPLRRLPYSLTVSRGQLLFTSRGPGQSNEGRCFWADNGQFSQFDDYGAGDNEQAHIAIIHSPGTLRIERDEMSYQEWSAIQVTVEQTRDSASVELLIRTPAELPDQTWRFQEPNLTLLLVRHHEWAGEILKTIRLAGCTYRFDPIVLAQVNPDRWKEPKGLAARINAILPKLDDPNWHVRCDAEMQLTQLGRDGAIYLMLRTNRRELSPQQNLAVDRIIRRYPVLSAHDLELIRRGSD